MVIIAGVVKIDPAKRDEVIAASLAVMKEVRRQPGCISYVVSVDLEDPTVVHVFQEWQSAETHLAHIADPLANAARFGAAGAGIREASFQRFEVASVGPIA